jgi:hypothetical protein
MRIFGWSQQDQMGWVAVIWGASHPSAWEANQYYSEKLKDIYIDIYIYTYTIYVDMLFFMLIHIVSQPGIDKTLADKKGGYPRYFLMVPKRSTARHYGSSQAARLGLPGCFHRRTKNHRHHRLKPI